MSDKSLLDELQEVDDGSLTSSMSTNAINGESNSMDQQLSVITEQTIIPNQDNELPYPWCPAHCTCDHNSNEIASQPILTGTVDVSNTNETNNANNATTVSDVDDNFACLICKDLLCEPVILLCQHAYCYECIKDFHKSKTKQLTDYWEPVPVGGTDAGNRCPCCKFPFTVPPKYNHEYEQAIERLYPEQYQTRKSEIRLKEKKDKLMEQMRKEVWNMISEKPPTSTDMWTNYRDLLVNTPRSAGRFRTEVLGISGAGTAGATALGEEDLFDGVPYRTPTQQQQDRKVVSYMWGWTKFILTNPLTLTIGAVYLTKRMGMI